MYPLRTSELEKLNEAYLRSDNTMIVLYGHRHVGLDDVLLSYAKDKPVFEFTCPEATAEKLLSFWNANVMREYGVEESDSFLNLFEALFALDEDESGLMDGIVAKPVVVIRDMEKALKVSPSLMEALCALVDGENPVQVILMSESLCFVENSFVSRVGRLAMRVDSFVKVYPVSFFALQDYFYNSTAEECVFYYSILGGFPGLWKHFDINLSFKENVLNNLLNPDSFLYREVRYLLLNELRELSVYETILATLCEGKTKLNDLHLATGFARSKISVYLKNLMELEFVGKDYSEDTPGNENAKKGVYLVTHPLIRFYFTFLYGVNLHSEDPNSFFKNRIQFAFRKFAAESFAEVTLQFLQKKDSEGTLSFDYEKMGRFVGKAGTIPAMCLDENNEGVVVFYSFERPVFTYEDYEWDMFLCGEARIKPKLVYLIAVKGFDDKILLDAKVKGYVRPFIIDEM